MGKLINPFIDFGFKYLFGREEHKRFLIDFLNVLFENDVNFDPIVDITYLDKEKGKRKRKERGVIYDIHCETSHGHRFVVEMQNSDQAFFFDRTIYYASKGVAEQGVAGKDWNFKYLPVYCVSFMKFTKEEHAGSPIIDVGLCNLQTKELFSDKMRLVYIQTPLFEKIKKEDCRTDLEKWMYNIVNMDNMETMAFTDEKALFAEFEEVASYANLSEEERFAYDADLKAYRDLHGQLEFAEARGEVREKRRIILNMKSQGIDPALIASITGASLEDILII